MTPAARAQTAIEILDRHLDGTPAEAALTQWARGARFAGSGDRAAVRDLVYDALRCRASLAARGGLTGRGLIAAQVLAAGGALDAIFTGARHAPAPLTPEELARLAAGADDGPAANAAESSAEDLAALDCPEWLAPLLRADLGADFEPVMRAQRQRAPLFLRANLARNDRAAAAAALAAEGIETTPHPLAPTALEVTAGARRVQGARAYVEGLVEVQDASSQAMVAALPLAPGDRVLDYCAGGGGKALAMAARGARVAAHDVEAARMRDIAPRAARAGVRIEKLAPGAVRGVWDLVLVDAPCSGSGTWRRTPEAKWRLDAARLAALNALQDQVLAEGAAHVRPGGHLAYMTCSLLSCENGARVAAFLAAHPGWSLAVRQDLTPLSGGDGFHFSLLCRAAAG
ncbi:RsmB/NOP family class I SAM-dependent RNA methyltransferase [Phaeovulum vinaykumarii]|uniref:16S rRNA (Cytosine967-C5)-methyltransferase n=1 Tax=Phaeovulum vinaykumarii TaxID=407234 RepID=A0A1N7M3N9_9RHOB|nr:RsmB/NOP family class I SAM-dependent RNA methyltransferase [Phaeovulum vinaykumarii]SIS80697.1 16S rRNA (cytosine967-C5)-methyltransferase [Phaeovulum vinaykumarii]SOC09025.1 16S rRNA (cytosine967-C5)-methyltransferase [Phaeovulum vinaykumarii]